MHNRFARFRQRREARLQNSPLAGRLFSGDRGPATAAETAPATVTPPMAESETSATPTPALNIPATHNIVSVSIIDTTTRVSNLPVAAFTNPQIGDYAIINNGVSYSFLIKHHSPGPNARFKTLLFDLGVRKDFDQSPTAVVQQMNAFGVNCTAEKNVADILAENGEDPASIDAIIWSHYHMDHTGDPATFPKSTALIVGPGFKSAFVPAWPTKPDSQVDEKAWAGRDLVEIDFTSGHVLDSGGYRALDFFGDGSFYLLDSPGHATGHMCGLARTKAEPEEFIFLGGDVVHHGSVFRPTELVPLPKEIRPNPLLVPFSNPGSFCAGEMFQKIHPKQSTTEPFVEATGFLHEDAATGVQSVHRLFDFDADDDIFVVFAHDKSLLDVIDFYPKDANDWKQKGWKEQGRWRFLNDFVSSTTPQT